jgi:hypothetical protein
VEKVEHASPQTSRQTKVQNRLNLAALQEKGLTLFSDEMLVLFTGHQFRPLAS